MNPKKSIYKKSTCLALCLLPGLAIETRLIKITRNLYKYGLKKLCNNCGLNQRPFWLKTPSITDNTIKIVFK